MPDIVTFERLTSLIDCGLDGDTKRLHAALDEAIAKVAAAVVRAGSKGSVTLKIGMKSKDRDALIIGADIKTSIPEPGALPILGYVDRKGNLVSEDPNQGRLPLGVIDHGRAVGGDE